MTTTLVSAAARPAATPQARRIPLADRAAAQHTGRIPGALDRITTAADNVPSASTFQSAL
ncbi:hypothetical protein DWB77_05350 [Streptomyces hundungensis]|uniref:FXSXX-COOH protein n=1 Tax=Streptomyces hundungensis TaxID=1077946 RepID=A0A387HI47_9ACTN|nr:hypothetical protein [Streptomyces hundungensis]AYG83154.1 hypothetical protein DWB77_05350 [Streptomyces hundungensis]